MLFQGEEGGEGDAPAEGEAKKKSGKPEKRLRNQFNFSERASQTLNNPYRVGTCTIISFPQALST